VTAEGFLVHDEFLTGKQWEALKAGRSVGPLEIVLVPPATVEGRILDADGRPGAGVRVVLTEKPQERYPRGYRRVTTTEDGAFRFTGVDPRRQLHLVAWRKGDGEEQRSRAHALHLEPGRGAAIWREIFLDRTEVVELTVALPPLEEGAKVLVTGEERPLDGRVLRTTVRTGPNRVTLKDVSCKTISEHDVEVPAGYRAFELTLPRSE
jgi:hypothetical protein